MAYKFKIFVKTLNAECLKLDLSSSENLTLNLLKFHLPSPPILPTKSFGFTFLFVNILGREM